MAMACSSFMFREASLLLLLLLSHIASVYCERERTLAMVKPDGVRSNYTDSIKAIILSSGFFISREKTLLLDVKTAESFYSEHINKPFFQELIGFMTSDSIVAMILEHEDAVAKWRSLMGSTDPVRAQKEYPNSIRAIFGSSMTQNCVHGSDSPESAEREIGILFKDIVKDEHLVEHDEL